MDSSVEYYVNQVRLKKRRAFVFGLFAGVILGFIIGVALVEVAK